MSSLVSSPPGQGRSRKARNIAARHAAERRERRIRLGGFIVAVAVVLGAGVYLAGSDLVGQRGATAVAGAIPMRVSMVGFDPNVLVARPGETLTIDWWNTDGAAHLAGGVHTLVGPALGFRETLPAESRKTIAITAPTTPGDYDFFCDSCCGGEASPSMHGTLRVVA
jgi:plastocyanin